MAVVRSVNDIQSHMNTLTQSVNEQFWNASIADCNDVVVALDELVDAFGRSQQAFYQNSEQKLKKECAQSMRGT